MGTSASNSNFSIAKVEFSQVQIEGAVLQYKERHIDTDKTRHAMTKTDASKPPTQPYTLVVCADGAASSASAKSARTDVIVDRFIVSAIQSIISTGQTPFPTLTENKHPIGCDAQLG